MICIGSVNGYLGKRVGMITEMNKIIGIFLLITVIDEQCSQKGELCIMMAQRMF